jgi:hypothetical protein
MVQAEDCVKVKSSAIQKFIFIFKPNDIKNRNMDIYGMNNSFFIRYRVRQDINNQAYEAIEHGHCRRFASDYWGNKGQCNAADTIKEICTDLIAIGDALIEMMFKMDLKDQHKIGWASQ